MSIKQSQTWEPTAYSPLSVTTDHGYTPYTNDILINVLMRSYIRYTGSVNFTIVVVKYHKQITNAKLVPGHGPVDHWSLSFPV